MYAPSKGDARTRKGRLFVVYDRAQEYFLLTYKLLGIDENGNVERFEEFRSWLVKVDCKEHTKKFIHWLTKY